VSTYTFMYIVVTGGDDAVADASKQALVSRHHKKTERQSDRATERQSDRATEAEASQRLGRAYAHASQSEARRGKTRQAKPSQAKPSQAKARPGKARQGEARRGEARTLSTSCTSSTYEASIWSTPSNERGTSVRISCKKTVPFCEFFLCLSRACLGKIMHFIYKWRKK
jgi:hypothetical protein